MKITKRLVDEVVIEAPMDDREKVGQYLYENNYHVRQSGPKMIAFGQCDMNIYQVVAYKTISESEHEG